MAGKELSAEARSEEEGTHSAHWGNLSAYATMFFCNPATVSLSSKRRTVLRECAASAPVHRPRLRTLTYPYAPWNPFKRASLAGYASAGTIALMASFAKLHICGYRVSLGSLSTFEVNAPWCAPRRGGGWRGRTGC